MGQATANEFGVMSFDLDEITVAIQQVVTAHLAPSLRGVLSPLQVRLGDQSTAKAAQIASLEEKIAALERARADDAEAFARLEKQNAENAQASQLCLRRIVAELDKAQKDYCLWTGRDKDAIDNLLRCIKVAQQIASCQDECTAKCSAMPAADDTRESVSGDLQWEQQASMALECEKALPFDYTAGPSLDLNNTAGQQEHEMHGHCLLRTCSRTCVEGDARKESQVDRWQEHVQRHDEVGPCHLWKDDKDRGRKKISNILANKPQAEEQPRRKEGKESKVASAATIKRRTHSKGRQVLRSEGGSKLSLSNSKHISKKIPAESGSSSPHESCVSQGSSRSSSRSIPTRSPVKQAGAHQLESECVSSCRRDEDWNVRQKEPNKWPAGHQDQNRHGVKNRISGSDRRDNAYSRADHSEVSGKQLLQTREHGQTCFPSSWARQDSVATVGLEGKGTLEISQDTAAVKRNRKDVKIDEPSVLTHSTGTGGVDGVNAFDTTGVTTETEIADEIIEVKRCSCFLLCPLGIRADFTACTCTGDFICFAELGRVNHPRFKPFVNL